MHPQNVSYIGMPTDPMESENINAEGIGKVLKNITNVFPITIIDCGSELSDLTLKALEFSTLIFLVVTPDILALNQTKRLYSDLVSMMFPKDMVQIILNQMVKGHPVSPEIVGKTLGKPVFANIQKDDRACTLALSSKKPVMVVGKNSAFAKGVVEVVRKITQKNVLKVLAKLNKPSEVEKRVQVGKQRRGQKRKKRSGLI